MAKLENLIHFSVICSEVTSGWQDILEDSYVFKHIILKNHISKNHISKNHCV